ncbi:conserved hypothetical protein [Mesorhizobium sp. ORS 3324]|nr:conserved hypothetical protein [Mesorhizobium sp. ORS 3324]
MAETIIFKPKGDAKSEATAKTARSIIEAETTARKAKTERLRAARLARGPVEAQPKKKPARRK